MANDAPGSATAGWHGFGATDTGLVRARNEDAFAADDDLACYLVADGLGGHSGGGVASALARDRVLDRLGEERDALSAGRAGGALESAVLAANAAVRNAAAADTSLAGMGTTLSILWAGAGQGWIAHVGDSRVYRLDSRGLAQITEDHTIAMQLVRERALTLAEARESWLWNQLTRAVGIDEDLAPDVFAVDTTDAEAFLLCSDGLTGMVADAAIERLLRDHAGAPEAACAALVDAAVRAGGDDNVTVVVLFPRGA